MKKIFAAAGLLVLSFAFFGCASSSGLIDMKNQNYSAPTQNAIRASNMLAWVYNTSTDWNDLAANLNEIGVSRQELESLTFSGNYEKPFGKNFYAEHSYTNEGGAYAKAKRRAKKIARLILKKITAESEEK